MNLGSVRDQYRQSMRQAHQELRKAITGRTETKDVAIYRRLSAEDLDELAGEVGMDQTIEYVLAMEKEAAGHGS